jgi:hypothetical protein
MSILIHAAMTAAIEGADSGVPGEIVYLPEGEHDITPTVNGKAKRITVKVPAAKGAAIAASLQAALEKRQGGNVRPWFDFEHKSGKASAIPTGFRYVAGKGIMAAVEWTGAGKAAIEGRDFSYLSPTFLIDAEGIPSGLPERGPLAALVNEPAFRDIPRIAAKDGRPNSNTHKKMDLILAHLGIDTGAADAESAALAKIQAAEAELVSLQAKHDELVAAAAAATKARHAALVEAAVTAGKIAPKDEATKTTVLEVLEANEALGLKALDLMPVQFAGHDTPLVNASEASGKGDATTRVAAAQAKARAELGADADFRLIWARAAEIDPSAFN